MDYGIFEQWFKEKFIPFVTKRLRDLRGEENAILFFDNCAAHPNEETLISTNGKIYVVFLPPNVTFLLQPIDQGVIATLKKIYKANLLREMVMTTSQQEFEKFMKGKSIF